MRLSFKALFVIFLSLFFIIGSIYLAGAQEEKVRAKIGIQIRSGDRIKRAKSQDRLKPLDLLRIYVHPDLISPIPM